MSIGSVRSSLFSVSPFLLRSTSSSTTTRFSPLLASSSSSNCLNSFRVSSQSFSPLSSSFSSTSSSSSSSSSLSLLRIQNERNQKMSFVPSSGSCYDYHYRRMGFWNEFKEKISNEIEKNQELKKNLDEIKEQASSFSQQASSLKDNFRKKNEDKKEETSEPKDETTPETKTTTQETQQEKEIETETETETEKETKKKPFQESFNFENINQKAENFKVKNEEKWKKTKDFVQNWFQNIVLFFKKGSSFGSNVWIQLREKGNPILLHWNQFKVSFLEQKNKFVQVVTKTKKDGQEKIVDSTEPVKEMFEKKTEEISSTIFDSHLGKKTKELKETVEKYVIDPTPNHYRPPGPIRPDDEMKALTPKEEALWKKQVKDLQNKLENTKVYQAMSDAKVAIEDSNNPVVQRGLDVVDNISAVSEKISDQVFGDNEETNVRVAIRQYIPGFDIEEFLPSLSVGEEGMIRTFLLADASNDTKTLREMCTEINMKRHELINERNKELGLKKKLNILWIDDPEFIQANFNDSNENPQLLVMFNVQCYEDFFDPAGNPTKGPNGENGGVEDCKAIRYLWLLQYDPSRGWLVQEDMIGTHEAIW